MSTWTHLALASLFVSLCSACTAAPPRTEFEQSIIGQEWEWDMGNTNSRPYPLSDQCKHLDRHGIQRNQKSLHGFSVDYFECDGRGIFLFEQASEGRKDKVIDALQLPKFKADERYMMTGDCEINGNTDTDFIAIVRLGQREKVDWKTGVRAAWMPTPETGKIEELPIRHVVCWRPTLP